MESIACLASGLFPPDFDFMAQHFDEYEIQAAELLACNEEAPHQSTIDEQMTRMELNPSHSCTPTELRSASEIDGSLLQMPHPRVYLLT